MHKSKVILFGLLIWCAKSAWCALEWKPGWILSDCCVQCCRKLLFERNPPNTIAEYDSDGEINYGDCRNSIYCRRFCDTYYCPMGNYMTQCIGNNDGGTRTCTSCTCPGNTYRTGRCFDMETYSCVQCKTCSEGLYAGGACFGAFDTTCIDCTKCGPGTRKTGGCQGSQNTICTPCSACPIGKYKTGGCGGGLDTADTECSETSLCCSECCKYIREYIAGYGSYDDTQCRQTKECKALCDGTYTCPAKTRNGITIPQYYDSCIPDGVDCKECSTSCAPGFFIKSNCSDTKDIKCEACTVCKDGFWISGCSGRADGVCSQCTACPSGKYTKTKCSGYTDSVCLTCETCPANQFSTTGGCVSSSSSPSSNCQSCPQYALSPSNSLNVFSCYCPAGTYGSNGTNCILCEPGKYGPISMKETETDACLTCASGKYSISGSTQCYNCPSEETIFPLSTVIIYKFSLNPTPSTADLPSVISRCSIRQTCADTYFMKAGLKSNLNTLSIQCEKCSTKTVACAQGKYHQCDGTALVDTTCSTCSTGLKPVGAEYIWDFPRQDTWGTASCNWGCAQHYFKDASTCQNCLSKINAMTCSVGQYIYAQCQLSSFTTTPVCTPCTSIAFATFTGSGSRSNDALSCAFVCNNGYFKSGTTQCKVWNSSLVCPLGQQRMAADSNQDYSCQTCSLEGTSDAALRSLYASNMFYDRPNTCSINCIAGTFLDSYTKLCLPCSQGKFKATTGTQECTQCVGNTYTSNIKTISCNSIPNEAVVWDSKIGFTCNAGYYNDNNLIAGETCSVCSTSFANSLEFAFAGDGTCTLSKFLCKSGFYRSSVTASDIRCIQCVSLPNMVLNFSSSSAFFSDNVVSKCGILPQVCSSQDEMNAMCYELITCNSGYFTQRLLTASGLTMSKSCVQCRSVSCAAGLFLQICKDPEQENYCLTCPQTLAVGQVWKANVLCQWQCGQGYYLDNAKKVCTLCREGKYKPLESNDTDCSFCPSNGLYADFVGMTVCKACEPGRFSQFSTVAHTTACSLCPTGKYTGLSGSSECTPCPQNSYSDTLGQSICTSCTDARYPLAPQGSSTCFLPQPPCPVGFFLPSSSFISEYFNYMTTKEFKSQSNIVGLGTFCQPCIAGLYCPGNNLAYTCTNNPTASPSLLYSMPLSASNASCTLSIELASELKETCQVRSSVAIACPSNTGTYMTKGAGSILSCYPKPGYYGLPGIAAKPCPLDHYCSTPAILPEKCLSSVPWSPMLSTSSSQCNTVMLPPCRQGYFLHVQSSGLPETTCRGCPSGSYCPGDGELYLCPTYAQSYSTSNPLSHLSSNCSAPISSTTTGFTSCPTNTLIPFSTSLAYRDVLQCRAKAGYYFIPTLMAAAIICPVGYYCPQSTQKPIKCESTATTCTNAGFLYSSALCPVQGMSLPNTTCTACSSISQILPLNAYYATLGSCDICCNANYYKQISSDGYTVVCTFMGTSATCPQNHYLTDITAVCTSVAPTCTQCTYAISDFSGTNLHKYYDFFVPIETSSRNTFITAGTIKQRGTDACHWQCKAGSYYDLSTRACTACPIGKYNPDALSFNKTACLDCTFGTYAAVMGSSTCRSCGKWSIPSVLETCSNCSIWDASRTQCIACRSWNPPPTGRTECFCMKGTQLNIKYQPSSRNSSIIEIIYSCESCAEGSVSGDDGCYPCRPGTICSVNNAITAPCKPGFFRNVLNTVCMPCALGTFLNITTTGMQTCIDCAKGTYANSTGSSSCTACSSSTYASNTKASVCTSCPVSATIHATKYCSCPAGNYFMLEENKCVSCKFQTCAANAIHTACPAGSTSDVSDCTCQAGFTGDGAMQCTACSNSDACQCSLGEVRAYKVLS